MNRFFVGLLFFALFLANTSGVFAYNVPVFPSCSNPSGDIKVEYVSGNHAIVGETALRNGSDKVYALFDGNTLQCFCPENGDGIQTNWWRIANLSQEDINSLKTQGWHFVPSGRDWGLSSDPYLAKNVGFNCKPHDNNESKSESSPGGGGSVLGSFAPTSGNGIVFIALIFGVSLILAALSLRKK